MTCARLVVGFLVTWLGRSILAVGLGLNNLGLWLMDRDDLLQQQKATAKIVESLMKGD